MKRIDLGGFVLVNDYEVWDCLRDINNILAEYAQKSGGRYSLDPAVAVDQVRTA